MERRLDTCLKVGRQGFTRIKKFKQKISEDPPYQRHQRSIHGTLVWPIIRLPTDGDLHG